MDTQRTTTSTKAYDLLRFDLVLPVIAQMPTYLSKHNYGLSDFQTPFQFNNRTSLPSFDRLAAQPPLQDRLNTYMQANRLGKSFWAS